MSIFGNAKKLIPKGNISDKVDETFDVSVSSPDDSKDITVREVENESEEVFEKQECNPIGEEDSCGYLLNHDACWKERQRSLLDYKKFYFCTCGGSVLGLVALGCLQLVLFYALAVAADRFFCPAVDTVSTLLNLPPDVAGATLLSFGNGAPDVFTQVAAITQGTQPDVLLALSSCLGSGMFITTVVLGVVVLVAPQPLSLDWTFRRDTLAYMTSVLLIGIFMIDGSVELYQSAILFVFYTGYLTMVIWFGNSSDPLDALDEEALLVCHSSKAVREFGIHPTITWLRDIIQWETKTPFQQCMSPITVPVIVVMHLTMSPEEPGRAYGAVIAVCGPIFFLTSMGVEPGEHSRFFFIFFSMVLLCAALYANSAVEIVSSKWLMPAVTFVQAILWMKLCAGSLVELLELTGAVLGLSPAFLGATVLAWGSSVADLAANASVARKQPKMAVAACVAGPLFNLLAGMSASLIYQNLLSGSVSVNLDNAALLIIGASVLIMLYMAVAIPTLHNFQMTRNWSIGLIFVYAVFTTVYTLNQMGALFTAPWLPSSDSGDEADYN